MFDSHIHTKYSPDSKQTLAEICESAIAKGLHGIAICDHVDICFAAELDTYGAMQACIDEVTDARLRYGDRLTILQGMEMAEEDYDPSLGARIRALCDYDVILGSVHTVYTEGVTDSYSRVDFSESAMPLSLIKRFFSAYLDALMKMVTGGGIDVLCHLTCPLRYINGKYGRGLDVKEFAPQIDAILRAIIRRNIALEVNTSGCTAGGETLPSAPILARYFELGGRRITLGSDAHIPDAVGRAFPETKRMLASIGFTHYCYFEKRVPHFIEL